MGTMTSNRNTQTGEELFLSTTLVILVTIAALALGALVMSSARNRTRRIEHQGILAQVPAGWPVSRTSQSSGMIRSDPIEHGLIFSASDPLDPHLKYSVHRLPAASDMSMETVASARDLRRGRDLNLYRVTGATPVAVADREGYRVSFAYVKPGSPGDVPTVVNGLDYYFENQTDVLLVSLEAEKGGLQDALPRFLNFVRSVTTAP